MEEQRETEDDTIRKRSAYKSDPGRMFRRRRSGRIIAEHGRLGFLESEDIDSTYVSPTLSVSSVLVADMERDQHVVPQIKIKINKVPEMGTGNREPQNVGRRTQVYSTKRTCERRATTRKTSEDEPQLQV